MTIRPGASIRRKTSINVETPQWDASGPGTLINVVLAVRVRGGPPAPMLGFGYCQPASGEKLDCGIDEDGDDVYTTEGIVATCVAICDMLKLNSSLTSLECAPHSLNSIVAVSAL